MIYIYYTKFHSTGAWASKNHGSQPWWRKKKNGTFQNSPLEARFCSKFHSFSTSCRLSGWGETVKAKVAPPETAETGSSLLSTVGWSGWTSNLEASSMTLWWTTHGKRSPGGDNGFWSGIKGITGVSPNRFDWGPFSFRSSWNPHEDAKKGQCSRFISWYGIYHPAWSQVYDQLSPYSGGLEHHFYF